MTQQFNTTSSMGRLTLNVLLSFAQFEREVTAERIRDKIAASKKKGMWMGGLPPLGYDNVEKKLVINEVEAETVRMIFDCYLKLGSVREAKLSLDSLGTTTKCRTFKGGRIAGGKPITRGNLYQILKNPIYIGQVQHKGEIYEGQHGGIVDKAIWDSVQRRLRENADERSFGANTKSPSLLTGLLQDDRGHRLTPSHADKKDRRYRYYIAAIGNDGMPLSDWRLPAKAIEDVVVEGVVGFLNNKTKLLKVLASTSCATGEINRMMVSADQIAEDLKIASATDQKRVLQNITDKVIISRDKVIVNLSALGLANWIGVDHLNISEGSIQVDLPISLRRRGVEQKIILSNGASAPSNKDHNLISVVAQGYAWFEGLKSGRYKAIKDIALQNDTDAENVTRVIKLAFLAPDIVETILQGHQPVELTAFGLKRLRHLPVCWQEQRELLGFQS